MPSNSIKQSSVTWRSPSNIALVKYWGKKGLQLPANASISLTLDNCHTETSLLWLPKSNGNQPLSVLVGGRSQPSFLPKIETFFKHAEELYPILSDFTFEIHTDNTFPHSSGIASSASGMSALALCVVKFLQLTGVEVEDFYQSASKLARLGSGSACRSVYGGVAMWGSHEFYKGSSDEYAIPITDVHEVFKTYHDDILIVHEGVKSVSSSVGHSLLNGHPFAKMRYEVAYKHMVDIRAPLRQGDLEHFIQIVEAEALMLHALMMTSNPSFILMKPQTLSIIEAIQTSRRSNHHHICFTLDAGANVHMLYPEEDKIWADKLIEEQLVAYCENGHYLRDNIGRGPIQINA